MRSVTQRARYAVRTITERLDYERADAVIVDDSYYVPATLAGVIDALESQCWDHVDDCGDAIICYPADCRVDYHTGDITRETIAIRADRPENLTRAIGLYRAREAARLAALARRS